ncbi:MAG: hypothetical protein EWM50_05505 [Gottschalkiaceae bacterium]|nr:MAG: hypothetical protein EWM50_05505 [Gottschalkiaceae bacterium]
MTKHKRYEEIITSGEIIEFLESATNEEIAELKDFTCEYFKHDVLSKRATLRAIDDYLKKYKEEEQ